MTCDSYCPPLVEQLHGPDPTAGSDCAIAVARMAIMFATCGSVNPSIDKIRAQANLDEPMPPPDDYSTTIWEYQAAINAFDDEARDRGYEGIKASVTERGRWDDLEPILKQEDRWVCALVDYGVLNDREPAKSGDRNFRGAHAIGVFGYTPSSETSDGTVKYRIGDPLCDGRNGNVPKGYTFWKASTLRDAMDAYAGGGSGTATWCVTPRAEPSDPEHPPEPPDPCSTTYRVEGRALLQLVYEHLRFGTHPHGDLDTVRLAQWVRRHQGGNPEGVLLPVREGVTPDPRP